MDKRQAESDHKAAEGAVSCFFGRNAQNGENKNEGQNDLNQQACQDIAVDACKGVCAETAGLIRHAAEGEDSREQRGTDESADHL